MSRVLVTGASGFVGRHVARAADRRGYEVTVLVRNARRDRPTDHPAIVREGDVRDAAAVRSALIGCDAVIHVAGAYTFDPSAAGEVFDVNVRGTETVLREALGRGVERIVYTGTVGTTAFSARRLATESDLAGPDTMCGPYKRSKYEAERLVRRLGRQGAPVVTVCPTAPIGPGDRRPTPTGRIVLDFMRGRIPAYVETGLNFVHVGDVATGHLLALERGVPGARYLLGNAAGNLTLAQAFRVLAAVTGRRAPRLRIPHALALAAAHLDRLVAGALPRAPAIPLEGVRMARTPMRVVDPSASVHALGLPQTPVETAFREAVDWFEKHGRAEGRFGYPGCI